MIDVYKYLRQINKTITVKKVTFIYLFIDFTKDCQVYKYQTTNKCTNCMSFILNHFFKTLFTAPTCFDSISLIARETTYTNTG